MIVHALLYFSGHANAYILEEIFETDAKAEEYAAEKGYSNHEYRVVEKEVL